jgi:hypothetical protein
MYGDWNVYDVRNEGGDFVRYLDGRYGDDDDLDFRFCVLIFSKSTNEIMLRMIPCHFQRYVVYCWNYVE